MASLSFEPLLVTRPGGARQGGVTLDGVVLALVSAVLVLGASWFVGRMVDYGVDAERDDLALVAQVATTGLDLGRVRALTGTPADAGGAAHRDVVAQLQRVLASVPSARFAYLLGRRGRDLIFLADAEPAGSPDSTYPGQPYEEAPEAFKGAFDAAGAVVHGPYRDRWGEWVTGLAPLRDADGRTVAVVAVDLAAAHYAASVGRYRLYGVIIATLVGLVVVLAVASLQTLRRYNVRLAADLAELNRAHTFLKLSKAVLDSMAEGVMVVDRTVRIESVNPAFERITGYRAAEVAGRSPKLLFSGRHDDAFFHELRAQVDAKGLWRGEIWNRRSTGAVYPQRTSISAIRDADGGVRQYVVLLGDNTAEHELATRLQELSTRDGLTGLANRRVFDEALAREWARAQRGGQPISLVMIDIDFFKAFNDRHGHLGGDACLRSVATAIAGVVSRSTDLVARYGGEEVAAVLPNTTADAAALLAERLRSAVESLHLAHGASATAPVVTVSVGVATARPDGREPALNLVARADQALYAAKQSGRNRVVSAPLQADDVPAPASARAA